MKLIILSFYLSSAIVFEVSLNVFSNINKVLLVLCLIVYSFLSVLYDNMMICTCMG